MKKTAQTAAVKSADRVMDIFELLAETRTPMSLTDIARALNLPPSSAYKLLHNMKTRGFLETDPGERLFYLGRKFFEIGTRSMRNSDLTKEFQAIAEEIVAELNESVYLSIRHGDKVLYVGEKQSTHPVRFVSHLGMALPLHATAMGKAMLAHLKDEELEALYPDGVLGAVTERTIRSLAELKPQLVRIREEGLAYSRGESVAGISCVAAPIFGYEGNVIAAMSVSVPDSRLTDELWENMKRAVADGAKRLSVKMYYKR